MYVQVVYTIFDSWGTIFKKWPTRLSDATACPYFL